MNKLHSEKWVTIKNPAAYFTDLIKQYHPKRKNRRSAIDK